MYTGSGYSYHGYHMRTITHTMVIERLKRLQGKRSLRQFSDDLKISHQYLADVYSGRRGLGETILTQLKLVKNPPGEPTYSEVKE